MADITHSSNLRQTPQNNGNTTIPKNQRYDPSDQQSDRPMSVQQIDVKASNTTLPTVNNPINLATEPQKQSKPKELRTTKKIVPATQPTLTKHEANLLLASTLKINDTFIGLRNSCPLLKELQGKYSPPLYTKDNTWTKIKNKVFSRTHTVNNISKKDYPRIFEATIEMLEFAKQHIDCALSLYPEITELPSDSYEEALLKSSLNVLHDTSWKIKEALRTPSVSNMNNLINKIINQAPINSSIQSTICGMYMPYTHMPFTNTTLMQRVNNTYAIVPTKYTLTSSIPHGIESKDPGKNYAVLPESFMIGHNMQQEERVTALDATLANILILEGKPNLLSKDTYEKLAPVVQKYIAKIDEDSNNIPFGSTEFTKEDASLLQQKYQEFINYGKNLTAQFSQSPVSEESFRTVMDSLYNNNINTKLWKYGIQRIETPEAVANQVNKELYNSVNRGAPNHQKFQVYNDTSLGKEREITDAFVKSLALYTSTPALFLAQHRNATNEEFLQKLEKCTKDKQIEIGKLVLYQAKNPTTWENILNRPTSQLDAIDIAKIEDSVYCAIAKLYKDEKSVEKIVELVKPTQADVSQRETTGTDVIVINVGNPKQSAPPLPPRLNKAPITNTPKQSAPKVPQRPASITL